MSLNNQKYQKDVTYSNQKYKIFDIKQAAKDCNLNLNKLPYSLRILFENVVRNNPTEENLLKFKDWLKNKTSTAEVDYIPARVLMQDFTGVPAIVDLASMRDAMKKLGGDPEKINPLIPVDLVIDHSLQVDYFGTKASFEDNVKKEIERNLERYQFLKWGQASFDNFSVVPPGTGICHQVNIEFLAKTIYCDKENRLYPDTLVGTDSHTTMVNALAVLGWGVGGIEAEAAMLGQALPMILPEVIGFKISGKLGDHITATDLVLTVTQILRSHGVVGKFVEFFGPGLQNLSLADRATISNMAPEYGATCGFFPIDQETMKYLELTGKNHDYLTMIREYSKEQNLWFLNESSPEYTKIVELDLKTVEPSLAGPKRPQDRVVLSEMPKNIQNSFEISEKHGSKETFEVNQNDFVLERGSVVIAAITSCTNTSNPASMVAAGLVAKKACELGLKVQPWVKTSLAPGSKVVTEYLKKAGLNQYLDKLGFNLVGYGCTTCIGNSGPLNKNIEDTIVKYDLPVASVLSGNRNFEGRVHPSVKANYLASPALVVAYALVGNVNLDFKTSSLGISDKGDPVYLKDVWPSKEEIDEVVHGSLDRNMFVSKYSDVFKGDEHWQKIDAEKSKTYDWKENSTYIKNPPYFDNIDKEITNVKDIKKARILALFGDSITTDHISPAGVISRNTPAAKYLQDQGVEPKDFNSYGARRGNHEVMMRGTFANVRVKNQLCPGIEGGVTLNHFTGKQMSIYDAAMDYKARAIPLVVIAGAEYGTGSSRDWAAKGTLLLGVKAVIAESFERIHRSNLVGMGVLPICFKKGENAKTLNLKGDEELNIKNIDGEITPYQELLLEIKTNTGLITIIEVILQVYTDIEVEYIKNKSILGAVLKNLKDGK